MQLWEYTTIIGANRGAKAMEKKAKREKKLAERRAKTSKIWHS